MSLLNFGQHRFQAHDRQRFAITALAQAREEQRMSEQALFGVISLSGRPRRSRGT
jgi:hypothetical protein